MRGYTDGSQGMDDEVDLTLWSTHAYITSAVPLERL
jgi:hypothetical protein